jgi:hypothetical protein
MRETKPTHTSPGGTQEKNGNQDDEMVNDSLGTVDESDSTGTDEDKKKEAENSQPRNR